MVLDTRTAGNVIVFYVTISGEGVMVIYVTTSGEGATILEQGEERHSQEQHAAPGSTTGNAAPTEGVMGNLGIQSALGMGTGPVPTEEGGIKEGLLCTEPTKSACGR